MLEPQAPGIPAPTPSRLSQPYWDGCRAGQLRFQRCAECGAIAPRPSPICGRCLQPTLRWEASAGRGLLYSWTVVWRPQHPAFRVPYAPAIVALDEGARVLSAVIGCAVDELRADLPLTVEFHPASHAIDLPYFRPEDR